MKSIIMRQLLQSLFFSLLQKPLGPFLLSKLSTAAGKHFRRPKTPDEPFPGHLQPNRSSFALHCTDSLPTDDSTSGKALGLQIFVPFCLLRNDDHKKLVSSFKSLLLRSWASQLLFVLNLTYLRKNWNFLRKGVLKFCLEQEKVLLFCLS